jgi:hypothetical protein
MEVSGQFRVPAALTQGKSPWYPLDSRLSGSQCRSGRGGEERNSQPLPGLETPIIQPVVQRYTTELFRPPSSALTFQKVVISTHRKYLLIKLVTH